MQERIKNELQIGKAGEHLVCADLILQGKIAFLSEQGLPYDVVFEHNGNLLKVQVKATTKPIPIPQRKTPNKVYAFQINKCGKYNKKQYQPTDVDIFALVALDLKTVAYIPFSDIKQTMFFRVPELRGSYRDDINPNRKTGKERYINEFNLNRCLMNLPQNI